MLVKVNILNSVVEVSCGDGKQSFKWLASVVQSRIKQFKILRNSFENESYIVIEIRNTLGELINPVDCIYEHASSNGLTVSAVTTTTFPVDEWENPEMGDWLQGAHVHSKCGKNWSGEIDSWREKMRESSHENGESGVKGLGFRNQHNASSSLIKIGFDFTQDDIASAFDLDWSNMKWTWLGSFATSENQRSLLGDALKTRYSVICNIFAHYCGVGQGECMPATRQLVRIASEH